MPGFAAYLASDICGYLLAITVNLLMIYGSSIENRCGSNRENRMFKNSFRWYFVPWLVINMIGVIALLIGSLVIFVWFTFVFPIVGFAFLSLIPLVGGAVLLYW